MAIDVQRRGLLSALASLAASPLLLQVGTAHANTTAEEHRLLAAWQQADQPHIGFWMAGVERLEPGRSVPVPTRAHGLMAERSGTVLAVARRPGDWLLRWHPQSGQTQWMWATDDRRFNGHVIANRNGTRLWTTETDLENAQGLLGLREAGSLIKTAEWPTHGMDPHQLLILPQALGPWPAGTLVVANGGIPTLLETGRSKRQAERMDPSLVAMHPDTGELLGQWRLSDPMLSIRHLAWDATAERLGIALQAEHTDPAAKASAPVLAVWDGESLRTSRDQPALAGYGADICALPGSGFVVSCTRANQLAEFAADGRFRRSWQQAQACALVADGSQWWSSGRDAALLTHEDRQRSFKHPPGPLQFDNHWQVLVEAFPA